MPVRYASGSEASILSFFLVTPRIVFKLKGSILPSILPPLLINIGLSFAAQESNPVKAWANDTLQLLSVLTPVMFVLSYLLVFKTHHGLNEIIEATRIVDEMATASRVLARAACSACLFHELRLLHVEGRGEAAGGKDGVKQATAHRGKACHYLFSRHDPLQPAMCTPTLRNTAQEDTSADKATLLELEDMENNHPTLSVRQLTRKIFRLLILYWHVTVEYFLRTGGNATRDVERQKMLRKGVRSFATEHELNTLYPQSDDSVARYCNPTVVLYWLKVICYQLALEASCNDPTLTQTNGTLGVLDRNFSLMDDIDKNQFPFPYAQLLKILTLFFGLGVPYVLEPVCGKLTPLISAFTAIAFFGLDELGEILDSPFGSDPNSVNLPHHARSLAEDLDTLWAHMRCGTVQQIMVAPENEEDTFSQRMLGHENMQRGRTSRLVLPARPSILAEGIERAVFLGSR